MIKYIVDVGWKATFEFDNENAAMQFATIALVHRREQEERESGVVVRIEEANENAVD